MLSDILALLCLGAMPVLALVCLVIARRMMVRGESSSAMYSVVLAEGAVVVLTALAYSMAPHLGWVTAIFCILSMVLLLMAGRVARGCSKRCEKWGDQADGAIQRVARAVSHYFDELDQSGYEIFRYLRQIGRILSRWLLVAFCILVLLDLVVAPFGLVRPWLSDGWDVVLRELNGATNATSNATSPALAQNATNYVTKASPPHEVIRNIGLLFAGILGIVFTAWRAMAYDRQTVVKEQGHLTDRFNKAAEQLGSEHVTVRIAAINALWRIGVDSKSQDDKRAVLDVLCGFVRAYKPKEESSSCPPDVQTVLDFLGKRMGALRFKPWRMDYVVDLSGARLCGCNLEGRSLTGVNLRGADLREAQATKVDLRNADLVRANVQEADLFGAHLEGALFSLARLEGAKLVEAHLGGADLLGAYLDGADLWSAHLEGADLWSAHLKGANLRGAHLGGTCLLGARLVEADLRGARLDGANLQKAHLAGAALLKAHFDGANLKDAHLNGAVVSGAIFENVKNLTQEQLDTACWDGKYPPTLPPGLACPPNYCEWDLAEQNVIPIDPPDPIAPCPAKEPDE